MNWFWGEKCWCVFNEITRLIAQQTLYAEANIFSKLDRIHIENRCVYTLLFHLLPYVMKYLNQVTSKCQPQNSPFVFHDDFDFWFFYFDEKKTKIGTKKYLEKFVLRMYDHLFVFPFSRQSNDLDFLGKQTKSTNKFSQNQPVAKRKSVFCLWIPNKNRWYRMIFFSLLCFARFYWESSIKCSHSLQKSENLLYSSDKPPTKKQQNTNSLHEFGTKMSSVSI